MVLRSYWNWRRGHWLQLNCTVVPIPRHLRQVQVRLGSGRVISSSGHPEKWRRDPTPHFEYPCPHHPVETHENKIWTAYLPIYSAPHFYGMVITTLGTKWDPRLKQRIQRKGEEFLPSRHTIVPWESSSVICWQTCCSVPILSQLSSLGTWASVSVPLSWDLSPKLPVYSHINVIYVYSSLYI